MWEHVEHVPSGLQLPPSFCNWRVLASQSFLAACVFDGSCTFVTEVATSTLSRAGILWYLWPR